MPTTQNTHRERKEEREKKEELAYSRTDRPTYYTIHVICLYLFCLFFSCVSSWQKSFEQFYYKEKIKKHTNTIVVNIIEYMYATNYENK